jgi:hypothetical protein
VLNIVGKTRVKSEYAAFLSSINSFRTEAEIIRSNNGGFYNQDSEYSPYPDDCFEGDIPFIESTRGILLNMLKYAGVDESDDGSNVMVCGVGKDTWAIAVNLNENKFGALISHRSKCFDSSGQFVTTNENMENQFDGTDMLQGIYRCNP